MAKVSVTGSRTWPATREEWEELDDQGKLDQTSRTVRLINEFIDQMPADTTVISGGAQGPDTIAETRAIERGLAFTLFPAEWKKYGKGAGFKRNKDIARYADECLVFWDGESSGTKNFIRHAFDMRRPLYIIGPEGVPWAVFDEAFYEQEGPEPRMDIPGM